MRTPAVSSDNAPAYSRTPAGSSESRFLTLPLAGATSVGDRLAKAAAALRSQKQPEFSPGCCQDLVTGDRVNPEAIPDVTAGVRIGTDRMFKNGEATNPRTDRLWDLVAGRPLDPGRFPDLRKALRIVQIGFSGLKKAVQKASGSFPNERKPGFLANTGPFHPS